MKEIKKQSVQTPETSNIETPTLPTERIRYHDYRGEHELIQVFDSLILVMIQYKPRPESDLGKTLERAKELSAKSKLSGSGPKLDQQEVLEVIKILDTFKKNPPSEKDKQAEKKPSKTSRMITSIAAVAGLIKRKE